MKRVAILIGAGVLTCFLILLSSDLIGRNEPPRAAAADTVAAIAPAVESPPEMPVRQVRVVLPAPFFSAEP